VKPTLRISNIDQRAAPDLYCPEAAGLELCINGGTANPVSFAEFTHRERSYVVHVLRAQLRRRVIWQREYMERRIFSRRVPILLRLRTARRAVSNVGSESR
jgi:hypothetical protein